MTEDGTLNLVGMTAELAAVYVQNNRIAAGDIAKLITTIHATLTGLGTLSAAASAPESIGPKPAVGRRKSLSSPEQIISMIDGKPYKVLTRHLKRHGHTPASYRDAYGLPADYPMVAANYSTKRREMAKTIGLGRKPEAKVPAKRGRRPRAPQASETPSTSMSS